MRQDGCKESKCKRKSSLFSPTIPEPRPHQPHAPIRQTLIPQTPQDHFGPNPIHTQNQQWIIRRIHFNRVDLRRVRRRRAGSSEDPRGVPGPVSASRARNSGGAAANSWGLGFPRGLRGLRRVFPWVLDLAKGSGLLAAPFFTQSCAVDCIYHRVYCGELKVPVRGSEVVVVPGLPPLRPEEMPSFIYVHGSYPSGFEMVTDQFQNIDKADWIFVNTFYKLEEEVINCMSRTWKVKAIGPTIPSMYLDKRLHDDKEYGLNIFETTTDVCTNWLSKKQPKSVIYISFGSLAQLSVEQIEELAHALTTLNKHFLWVVRSSELAKLPKNFSEESSEKGLIVSWCQQLEILAHDAVGCFVTHCGWNSTLEGLSLGVPIVAMPQWTDQSTNTKFVVDVWRVGIWARADEKGLVREGEIRRCIKHVMEGDGEEIRENASKWKEMARDAVDEGGSSDRNIQEFVSTLVSLKGVN
ncbi:UNVERIFIED_CONTAM: UDP-glycosyltransferase 74E2 [Sesamum angustifolium]|uniref:Glycosyltransferase n=1 Tax=Sesamum angustifolium TaxID=2727405 RepID=A0AAW2PW18_9LAMI